VVQCLRSIFKIRDYTTLHDLSKRPLLPMLR